MYILSGLKKNTLMFEFNKHACYIQIILLQFIYLSNLFLDIDSAYLTCLGERMVMINYMHIENSYSVLLL